MLNTCIFMICLPPIKVAIAIMAAIVINYKPQAFL